MSRDSGQNAVLAVGGCFGILLFCIAFGALGGIAASWVLSYFGVFVPWYVCWVANTLIMGFLSQLRGK